MNNINKDISPFIQQKYNLDYTFSGYDSEERFKENLKIMPLDWKYRTKEIFYKHNSSGYRTHEWKDIDWKNAIVVLGCSIVFGIGLAEDETMCYQIEKMTGRQTINLGYGAGSNNIIINNLSGMINDFDAPYAVVIFWSGMDRFTIFEDNHIIHNIGGWVLNNKINKELKKIYLFNSQYKKHIINSNYLLTKQARAICKNKSRYLDYSFFSDTAKELGINFLNNVNNARDLSHPGYETNRDVAVMVSQKINNLKNFL